MNLHNIDLEVIISIAQAAGREILHIYNDEDFSNVIDFKDDNSPLTLADKASNQIIERELQRHFPAIPVLSEEGRQISYDERSKWETFWLVDPLDGTKEFIKRNGEFTVNIALIHQKKPILGVIFVPVKDQTYVGEYGKGAYKIDAENKIVLRVNNKLAKSIAVRSKSHASPEEEAVLQRYGISEFISVGSSLKFCMVAEGKADIYYRHGPTMEWDTGAGQAIAEAAGARVYVGNTENTPFTYNKKELLNGSFLVVG